MRARALQARSPASGHAGCGTGGLAQPPKFLPGRRAATTGEGADRQAEPRHPARRERPVEAGRLRARVDLRAWDCAVPDGARATRPPLPVPGSLRELGIAPFRVTSIWPGNLRL